MAKNKKQKPIQLLSPENYIRQKVRNLPIYECLINPEWEESGTASIVVTRRHASGAITCGVYLVDLLCFGVKDTLYFFNITIDEYKSRLESMDLHDLENVDYNIVHNIIYTASEFANELQFKPHKDFTATTRYMLEEDTDEIEFIDITCGHDGKPVFIKTDIYTNAEANRVINQLNLVVGSGNYEVIIDNEFLEDEDTNAEADEYDNLVCKTKDMNADERRHEFLNILKKEEPDEDDIIKLGIFTQMIFSKDIANKNVVSDMLDSWDSEIKMPISGKSYTAEMLGLESGIEIDDDITIVFDDIVYKEINGKIVADKIELLEKELGQSPFLEFLRIREIESVNKKKRELNILLKQYPDYPLFKLEKINMDIAKNKKVRSTNININDLFWGRDEITSMEMAEFQYTKTQILFHRKYNDYSLLEAQFLLLKDIAINDIDKDRLNMQIPFMKIQKILEYYNAPQLIL
ncbi:MAG: hypothetical protein ACK5L7_00425 [Paludibacteraceae bacterium]